MRRWTTFVALCCLSAGVIPAVQAAPGAAQRGRMLLGKVIAKDGNTLEVQQLGKDGGQSHKVTLGEKGRVMRFVPAMLPDLTEGHFVSVFGTREGEKFTAQRIVRLEKPEGEAKEADWKGAALSANAGARIPGGARGRMERLLGRIVAVEPLTVQTREGAKVEVVPAEGSVVVIQSVISLADIAQGARVLVIRQGKETDAAAITAQAVVEMPARAADQGERRKKK